MKRPKWLRPSDVLAIQVWYRDRDKYGGSYRVIAKKFKVSHMTIARIVRREGRYK